MVHPGEEVVLDLVVEAAVQVAQERAAHVRGGRNLESGHFLGWFICLSTVLTQHGVNACKSLIVQSLLSVNRGLMNRGRTSLKKFDMFK